MTIVGGVSVMHQTPDAVLLAAMLARSASTDLALATVVPAPWTGKGAQMDRDYRDHLVSVAGATVSRLARSVPEDVECRIDVRQSASVSEGLVEAVGEEEAPILVLGSSTAGLIGRVSLGSVTERLMHSSPVPVAVAPRGFSTRDTQRVTRVTIAYAVGPDETSMVKQASQLAGSINATTRLVSFAVRPEAPLTSGVGPRAEQEVLDEWEAFQQKAAGRLRSQLERLDPAPEQEAPTVGRGTTWAQALKSVPWAEGDVLVVASSRSARSARVFLGSTASKISRHSPVPVIVVPRRALKR
ncbi:MAG: universal stress protein [Propionibacteriales bacterium]|nr:universal stress protein [Propionibacteriales bacterium]